MRFFSDATEDAIQAVFVGIYAAIPLAFVAWGVDVAGIEAAPVLFIPVVCAFFVGRMTAYDKWMRETDARIAAMKGDDEP